jgi:hypothetical protein
MVRLTLINDGQEESNSTNKHPQVLIQVHLLKRANTFISRDPAQSQLLLLHLRNLRCVRYPDEIMTYRS